MNRNQTISLYEHDRMTIKKLSENLYKGILLRSVRKKGYELKLKVKIRCTANTEKLENNISRAKTTIFEYAICNPWEYFVTLTIDPKKYDRTDLKKYNHDLNQMISSLNRSLKPEQQIKFLLIPELHQDGKSWHMHGLLHNIPENQLQTNQNGYKTWINYQNRFGYISMDKMRNHEACSKYMTKYIRKDMDKTMRELNTKSYYCSTGLKRAEIIKSGTLCRELPLNPTFENDYCKIYKISKNDLENIYKCIIT